MRAAQLGSDQGAFEGFDLFAEPAVDRWQVWRVAVERQLQAQGEWYHIAVERAGDRAAGSVAASDAFFPFADGLQILIDAGVKAVVQPGGSVRDEEVVAAAEAAGVTLYLTGARHFFHG